MKPSEYVYNNPNGLMDVLLEAMDLDSDEGLACALGIAPLDVSRLRRKELPIGPSLLLLMLEVSDTGIHDLRNLIAAKRAKYH